jgi:hypothetical protein
MDYYSRLCGLPGQRLEGVPEEPHTQAMARHCLIVLSIVKGQLWLLPQAAGMLEAFAHLDRTLAGALGACRTVQVVDMLYSTRKDLGKLGRTLLVAVCSKATTYC